MLLPEARLDTLIEQLEGLPRGDRKAIMAQLSQSERAQLIAHMRPAASLRPTSPYSPDIAGRLDALTQDAGDLPVTPAGRAALANALDTLRARTTDAGATGTLVDAIFGLFRAGGARR